MPPQQGDIIEVTARAEFDGIDDIVNVYEISNLTASGLTDSELVEDILDMIDDVYTIINGFLSIYYIYRDITIRNRTGGYLMGIYSWPTLVAGTAGGDALPPGVAGIINFSTTQPRRMLRKYIGGLSEASCESTGVFESLTQAQLALFGAFLLAPYSGTYGLYQYCTHNDLMFPETIFPVSTLVTNIPGYQRRRKQGRGS